MNLYEQHKAAWDKLAKEGKPNLREMAKRFEHPHEMDAALQTQRAVHHWIKGENGASYTTDRRAAMWLAEQADKGRPDSDARDGIVLMVVCPAALAPKVQKLLGLMGCEVVEV
jgi:hypothetical protein